MLASAHGVKRFLRGAHRFDQGRAGGIVTDAIHECLMRVQQGAAGIVQRVHLLTGALIVPAARAD